MRGERLEDGFPSVSCTPGKTTASISNRKTWSFALSFFTYHLELNLLSMGHMKNKVKESRILSNYLDHPGVKPTTTILRLY